MSFYSTKPRTLTEMKYQCFEHINEGIGKPRIIGKNTFEYYNHLGMRIIRLWDTDILGFGKNFVVVNTGGYNTITTRKRINSFLYNDHKYRGMKSSLYVFTRNNTPYLTDSVNTVELADNMIYDFISKKFFMPHTYNKDGMHLSHMRIAKQKLDETMERKECLNLM